MISNENMAWLQDYRQAPPNLGLERVAALLDRLGNPQEKLSLIHVAGTNGKGSTIAHLSAILQEMGLKVGVFNSPYLVRYSEQIRINQEEISEQDLNDLLSDYQASYLAPAVPGLTEFEIVTALALDYFNRKRVDVAIIEVGMGGRLDSTNIIQPDLSLITNIALDHTAFLGDSLAEIAAQKGGIIKESVPLICGPLDQAAAEVIQEIAQEKGALMRRNPQDFYGQALDSVLSGETFVFNRSGQEVGRFRTPLLGQHQIANASLAMEAAFLYAGIKTYPSPDTVTIQRALDRVEWQGRMEELSAHPLIFLDGAHNPHAVRQLVDNLADRFAGRPLRILFACIQTKALEEMLAILEELPGVEIYLTTFDDERAYPLEVMQDLAEKRGHRAVDWEEWLRSYQADDQVLVITGSLYFIGQVKKQY